MHKYILAAYQKGFEQDQARIDIELARVYPQCNEELLERMAPYFRLVKNILDRFNQD